MAIREVIRQMIHETIEELRKQETQLEKCLDDKKVHASDRAFHFCKIAAGIRGMLKYRMKEITNEDEFIKTRDREVYEKESGDRQVW